MKILLIQTSFLGDTILSTPVIAGLKKLYPECELWMMTTAASKHLVEADPLLSGVIVDDKQGLNKGFFGLLAKARELRLYNFDLAYSLHKSHRTALLLFLARIPCRIGFTQAKFRMLYTDLRPRAMEKHDVIRNLSLLLPAKPDNSLTSVEKNFDTALRLYVKTETRLADEAEQLYALKKPVAVLFPGSVWKTKMWKWEGFREVGDMLEAQGFSVIVMGGKSEENICAQVCEGRSFLNLAGKTSLASTMKIVELASLLICNDSMALHMASAFKIPNVSIFCATSPSFGFGPWQNRAEVVEKKDLACKPCARHGSNMCPQGTDACMQEVSAQDVMSAVHRVLKSNRSLQVYS